MCVVKSCINMSISVPNLNLNFAFFKINKGLFQNITIIIFQIKLFYRNSKHFYLGCNKKKKYFVVAKSFILSLSINYGRRKQTFITILVTIRYVFVK